MEFHKNLLSTTYYKVSAKDSTWGAILAGVLGAIASLPFYFYIDGDLNPISGLFIIPVLIFSAATLFFARTYRIIPRLFVAVMCAGLHYYACEYLITTQDNSKEYFILLGLMTMAFSKIVVTERMHIALYYGNQGRLESYRKTYNKIVEAKEKDRLTKQHHIDYNKD